MDSLSRAAAGMGRIVIRRRETRSGEGNRVPVEGCFPSAQSPCDRPKRGVLKTSTVPSLDKAFTVSPFSLLPFPLMVEQGVGDSGRRCRLTPRGY
jgi:hypothetical protein